MKWMLKALLILTLLAGVVLAWAKFSLDSYMDSPMGNAEPFTLVVEKGATLRDVSRDLRTAKASQNTHWLLLRAKLDETAGLIKAGQYTVPTGMTPTDLLAMLIAGKVDLERVSLIEGWTAAQAVNAIISHPEIVNDLDISIDRRVNGEPWLGPGAQQQLASMLSIPHRSVEGMLAPDTYQFAAGSNASEILKMSHSLMLERVQQTWDDGLSARGIENRYAFVTLASIVEKETGLASERPAIAGVFVRRLARGMKLQTDPTVIYGIGPDYDGDIRRRDLNAETPYNTYVIDGLPPTPIALVGLASLQATANPADGKALFFVATGKGDGSHEFSETNEAHERAVTRYLERLRSQGD
ncbi:MAG: endolytic transglycosylase MltG [Pseudomonadota bacterium]